MLATFRIQGISVWGRSGGTRVFQPPPGRAVRLSCRYCSRGTFYRDILRVMCSYLCVKHVSYGQARLKFGKVAADPCRAVVNRGIERVIDSARSWIEPCSQESYTSAIIG